MDHATGRRTRGPNEHGVIEEEILKFMWWFNAIPMRDQRWWVNPQSYKHFDAVDKAFKDKQPGDAVFIERADWEFLKNIVENPKYIIRDPRTGSAGQTDGYENPIVARNTRPFVRAVVEASEEKPAQ
jgi:hypothetical protein